MKDELIHTFFTEELLHAYLGQPVTYTVFLYLLLPMELVFYKGINAV
jgi:hypothetical protein